GGVERGVEARDLRYAGRALREDADRREVVRLVQRRERRQPREIVDDRRRQPHRRDVALAAVHDPVPDRGERRAIVRLAEIVEQELDRAVVRIELTHGECALRKRRTAGISRGERRRAEQVVDDAGLREREVVAVDREHGELEARRARVDDEDRVAHRGVRRACTQSFITAVDARRERTLSAREVSTIGTRAPMTMPALAAPARYCNCFATMLPASRSGASRMSAQPATGETMPLVFAASGLTALSNASGPSRTPPVIWPRSAILHNAAASSVACILGLTTSTAARIATFGHSMPRMRARSIAFCAMSALAFRSGVMLIAASVTNRSRGYAGTSRMNVCDIRRAVRRLAASATTASINSSVCRLPFISASTLPSRAIAAAAAAAAWLCSVATIAMPARSAPHAAAAARIFASGPTSVGTIMPRAAACSAPSSESRSQGCTTAQVTGGSSALCAS